MLLMLKYASAQTGSMTEVVNALRVHSIGYVVNYFDDVVDITLNDKQSTYSKAQATIVVKNFIAKYKVFNFQLKYKGAAPDESFYLIGEIDTKERDKFHVYFYFKPKDNRHVLQELKFEQ